MAGKTSGIGGSGDQGGFPARTVDLEIGCVSASTFESPRLVAGIRRGPTLLMSDLNRPVDCGVSTRRRKSNTNIDVFAVEEKGFVPTTDCVESVLTDEKAAAGKDIREELPVVAIFFQARDRGLGPGKSHVHGSDKPWGWSRS